MNIKGTGINDFLGNKKPKRKKFNVDIEEMILFVMTFLVSLGVVVFLLSLFLELI